MPTSSLKAALKELASAPGLRVEVEDMHPITDKIMQVWLYITFQGTVVHICTPLIRTECMHLCLDPGKVYKRVFAHLKVIAAIIRILMPARSLYLRMRPAFIAMSLPLHASSCTPSRLDMLAYVHCT